MRRANHNTGTRSTGARSLISGLLGKEEVAGIEYTKEKQNEKDINAYEKETFRLAQLLPVKTVPTLLGVRLATRRL